MLDDEKRRGLVRLSQKTVGNYFIISSIRLSEVCPAAWLQSPAQTWPDLSITLAASVELEMLSIGESWASGRQLRSHWKDEWDSGMIKEWLKEWMNAFASLELFANQNGTSGDGLGVVWNDSHLDGWLLKIENSGVYATHEHVKNTMGICDVLCVI